MPGRSSGWSCARRRAAYWRSWRVPGAGQRRGELYKLYVSPAPESTPDASTPSPALAGARGRSVQGRRRGPGLCRPDKLVAYFAAWRSCARPPSASASASRAPRPRRAVHGRDRRSTGCSRGAPTRRGERPGELAPVGRERLAEPRRGRRRGEPEPWRFALERLGSRDDTETWAPASTWVEQALGGMTIPAARPACRRRDRARRRARARAARAARGRRVLGHASAHADESSIVDARTGRLLEASARLRGSSTR